MLRGQIHPNLISMIAHFRVCYLFGARFKKYALAWGKRVGALNNLAKAGLSISTY